MDRADYLRGSRNADAMDLLLELTNRYCEPHRHYHTLEHVAAMLHAGRALQLDQVQAMAIWFHDAIYDPQSATNEADSAALARDCLDNLGWPEDRIARVEGIVLDTDGHRPTSAESAVVLDLDLMSLASPWHVFVKNGDSIRKEHPHLADDVFEAGRRDFLGKMLARDRLFHSPFGATLEARARENLRRSLATAD